MNIRENVNLSSLTTMRLGGPAKYAIEVESKKDVEDAYAFAAEYHLPVHILGGGANSIGRDEGYDGVIILNKIKGVNLEKSSDELILTAGGGEIWDDLSRLSAEQGYTGIEAMAKIPGTAGAAPVQNIGAYGQEIKDTLVSVETFDVEDNKWITIPASDMDFAYRKSIFNSSAKGRYFIAEIKLKLKKGELKGELYRSLQAYLDEHHITDRLPLTIYNAVSAIRDFKLPDPDVEASSGSFFKNLVLTPDEAKLAETKGIPIFTMPDGTLQINTGFLIEQAGLKGKVFHGMRVSDKAALILINDSAKSFSDLEAAKSEIQAIVKDKYGYDITMEPEII